MAANRRFMLVAWVLPSLFAVVVGLVVGTSVIAPRRAGATPPFPTVSTMQVSLAAGYACQTVNATEMISSGTPACLVGAIAVNSVPGVMEYTCSEDGGTTWRVSSDCFFLIGGSFYSPVFVVRYHNGQVELLAHTVDWVGGSLPNATLVKFTAI